MEGDAVVIAGLSCVREAIGGDVSTIGEIRAGLGVGMPVLKGSFQPSRVSGVGDRLGA